MSAGPRSGHCHVGVALWLIGVASSCSPLPVEAPVADIRQATAAAIDDFLERYRGGPWPLIYLSDEHVAFSVDRVFIERLDTGGVPIELAHRTEVEVSPDTIRDGALLLEPSGAVRNEVGSLTLHLAFSQTSQFGGEFQYTGRRSLLGRWYVAALRVVWIA